MTKNLAESRRKKFVKNFQKLNNNENTLEKQLSNYKTRAEAAGVKKDNRNIVEQALNLPEDQNVLFDIMEIIGRPQQALFGAIQEAQEGGDALEGAKKGISGEQTYYGGDILRNWGVDDTALFTNPLTGDDVSTADILGLGFDIFADPLDIPVAGTGKTILENAVGLAGKGAKGVSKVADSGVTKALEKADTKNLTKTIKQIGVDEGLIKAGTKLDNAGLESLAKSLTDMGYDLTRYQDNLSDIYKTAKRGISKTINYKNAVPDNLYNKITRTDNAIDAAVMQGKTYLDELNTGIKDYLTAKGMNVSDDVINELGSNINTLISSKYAPEITANAFLGKVLTDGKNTIAGTTDEINDFAKQLDKLNLSNVLNYKISNDGTTLTMKKAKGLENVVNNNALKESLDNIKFINKEVLPPETIKKVDALKDLYAKDEAFKNLVDTAESQFGVIDEIYKQATNNNISFRNMLREGYTSNTMTKEGSTIMKEAARRNLGLQNNANEVLKDSSKLVSGKNYSNVPEVAEQQIKSKLSDIKTRKQKELDNLKNATRDTELSNLYSKRADLANRVENEAKLYQDNLNKLNISKGKKDTLVHKYNTKVDSVRDIVNEDIIKKASQVYNEKQLTSLSSAATKYNNASKDYVKLQKQLANPNLTEKEINKLLTKFEKASADLTQTQNKLLIETAKVKGAASEKFIKGAGEVSDKLLESSSKATKQTLEAQKAVDKVDSKITKLNEGFNNVKNSLVNQQKQLELKIQKLENMTPAEITAKESKRLQRMGNLQKDIDFLTSAEGIQFYETSFFNTFGDFLDKTSKEAKNLNMYNEVILHSGLNDENIMKFIPKGEKAGKIPVGYTRLGSEDADKIVKILEKNKNFLPNDSHLIKDLKNQISNSSAIIIDDTLKDFLKINVGENEMKPIIGLLDKFNNNYKKFKVATPGNQLRNISGNALNMSLSGVPTFEIPGLYNKAKKLTNKEYILDLFNKNAKGVLSATEKSDFDLIYKYMQGGFLGQGKEIQDLVEAFKNVNKSVDKNIVSKGLDKLFTTNLKLNENVDNLNRMALLAYAEKNPKYLKKLGVKDSIDAVKEVLFDPKNLSPFEQKYLKRIVPFYTFTKQNLVFQANNIMRNTSKYNRLFKTLNSAYDAAGEGTYRQYQKENMELPLFKDSNGNLVTLKSNLPVADLGDYMSDPIKRLVSSTTPLIKAPIEMATGVDTYTGQELYKSTPEQLANYLGVDTLTTAQFKKISNLFEDVQDDADLTKFIADLLPSVLKYNDTEKIQNSNMYEELQEYQELFSELKKQGIDIPTIKELSDNSNITLRNLKNRRAKLKRS